MVPSQPFRFLELPKELRLIVYEVLPIRIKHHHLHQRLSYSWKDPPKLVIKTVEFSILATCRMINSEASPIAHRTSKLLRLEPVRFISCGHIQSYYPISDIIDSIQGKTSTRAQQDLCDGAGVTRYIQAVRKSRKDNNSLKVHISFPSPANLYALDNAFSKISYSHYFFHLLSRKAKMIKELQVRFQLADHAEEENMSKEDEESIATNMGRHWACVARNAGFSVPSVRGFYTEHFLWRDEWVESWAETDMA